MLGQMTSSPSVFVDDSSSDKLLSHLMGLDRYQLEDFKLCVQSPQLLPENVQKISWANLKAISPTNLLCLLKEHLSVRQIWDVTLRIFEHMKLTSLCEQMRAEMNGEWVCAGDSFLVLVEAGRLLLEFYGVLPNCWSPPKTLPDGNESLKV